MLATMPFQGKMFLYLARTNRGAQHDRNSLIAIVSIRFGDICAGSATVSGQ